MNDPLPPLSARATALLGAHDLEEQVPPEVAERLWRGLAAALPAIAAVEVATAARATGHLAGSVKHAPFFEVAKAFGRKHVVAAGLGLFGAGAGSGLATTVVVQHQQAVRAQRAHSALPPAVTGPVVVAPAPVAPPPPPVPLPTVAPEAVVPLSAPPQAPSVRAPKHAMPTATVTPTPTATVPATPTLDSDLASERSLIARARSALQHSAPEDALRTLATHAAQFPQGRLAEERDALRVEALVASGDRAQAEHEAAEFTRKYPQSLMGPAVRSAIQPAP